MFNQKAQSAIWVVAIIAIIIIIALVAFAAGDRNNPSPSPTSPINISNWKTYTNQEFGFSVQYPPEWQVVSSSDQFEPKISIYKPGSFSSIQPPFTHFSLATHVSIYPEGIPTEGVFGETKPSTIQIRPAIQSGIDYILEDGTEWASFFNFENTPTSWNESGFVWAGVRVENLDTFCLTDEGQRISEDRCDPLGREDITVIRMGTVDQQDRATQEAILGTFSFTASSSPTPTQTPGHTRTPSPTRTPTETPVPINELIRVATPIANARVTSPLIVSGDARGPWYFEASFPARLIDANGNTLGTGIMQAQSDWMTEQFVPFRGTITFATPTTQTGTLILQKDNPSGLPEFDRELRLPVRFQ